MGISSDEVIITTRQPAQDSSTFLFFLLSSIEAHLVVRKLSSINILRIDFIRLDTKAVVQNTL